MAAILSAEAPSAWRVLVILDGAGSTTPSNYTLARADGVAGAPSATLAFAPGGQPNVIAMGLSAALLPGVIYALSVSGAGSAQLSFQPPIAPANVSAEEPDDPEAEAYGVDVAWLVDTLGAGGRLPRRRGIACVKFDLATIAVEVPGDRFHRPAEGGGLRGRVNGPGAPGELARAAAQVKRQWSRDPRVERGGVAITASIDSQGRVTLDSTVQTVAIGQPVPVRVTGA